VRRATLLIAAAPAFFAVLTSSLGAFPGAAPRSVHGGVVTSGAAMRIGRSVGSPTAGHLVGGAHLDDAGYLRIVPSYTPGDVRWGLGPLVGMIDRAARSVRHQYPDAVLSVGHLSRPGGGEVDRHRSHESGRDADVAFYVKNHLGKPAFSERFVPFRGDGTAPSWPGAVFDDERNWAFVASLLRDPVAHVSHIFVASPLRARLLAYAERVGVSPALRARAAETLAQPRGSLPHDDHFHVRISCPGGMRECVENPEPRRFARVLSPHARPRASSPAAPAGRTPRAEQTAAHPGDREGGAGDRSRGGSPPSPSAPPDPPSSDLGAPAPPPEAASAPPPSAPAVLDAPLDLDDVDGEP